VEGVLAKVRQRFDAGFSQQTTECPRCPLALVVGERPESGERPEQHPGVLRDPGHAADEDMLMVERRAGC
jgi:hypothetical protein